jgi:hypothetical protein
MSNLACFIDGIFRLPVVKVNSGYQTLPDMQEFNAFITFAMPIVCENAETLPVIA